MHFVTRFAALVPFLSCACTAPTGPVNEPTGEVSLAVTTVPTGVQCIQVTASGSSAVTKQFTVAAGATSVGLALGELPLGNDVVSGQAYNVACAAIATSTPTWVADSQTVAVKAGLVSNLELTFRQDNSVGATANFVGNITQIATSSSATYYVMSDGTVRGVGYTYLAPSTTTDVVMPGLSGVVQVAAGVDFACALLSAGNVKCWGQNQYAQLGFGAITSFTYTTPAGVNGIANATQITAGVHHACALLQTGTVQCWGYNADGELGDGNLSPIAIPTSTPTANVIQVVAGDYFTCALTGSGTVDCWGQNTFGELGNGNTTSSANPVFVYRTGSPFTAITAGAYHACGLQANGGVECWGANFSGQLGTGGTTSSSTPYSAGGSIINGGEFFGGITQIAAAGMTTCAISSGKSSLTPAGVYCWGDDSSGQLGDGNGVNQSYPMVVPGMASATSFATGPTANAFCTVMSSMAVECWGSNIGSLGTGNTTNLWTPTVIPIQ